MEGSRLKIAEASNPNFMSVVERAIRMGEACLLQVLWQLSCVTFVKNPHCFEQMHGTLLHFTGCGRKSGSFSEADSPARNLHARREQVCPDWGHRN